MRLILASTSRYRGELLQRLRLPFETAAPGIDESPLPGEPPPVLAARLAKAKAEAVGRQQPGAWVIGSDQCAELLGKPLGKPGHRQAAIKQLAAMSGHPVDFHTAVCLWRDGTCLQAMDTITVRLRPLSSAEIERYVDAEQPLDCAGSFKSEGLGIALFDSIDSHDPTALIGLPLIALSRLLREAGFELP
ncbi:septum formation inhibitor Maf [Pseudoxanthomonas kalamensis DSM 18571]|uniref:Maf family protein n=1 Tax=Pseudoxanthomonas kalamensis TaxID=289483 RepID=UPI001390B224|nr:Maf family nucleotide pyrophosphatase [Pseudoxanthomonas kalamensis]KAF1709905.1 septum formation inhibitor Maf [Pseudoxanthomonas kalamensis DSM 18571]